MKTHVFHCTALKKKGALKSTPSTIQIDNYTHNKKRVIKTGGVNRFEQNYLIQILLKLWMALGRKVFFKPVCLRLSCAILPDLLVIINKWRGDSSGEVSQVYGYTYRYRYVDTLCVHVTRIPDFRFLHTR